MLSASRIPLQGLTPHLHEQQAVRFVIDALPDRDPLALWALFDLVEGSGRRYELDLLVLGYSALYHIEIKSYPGKIRGDICDWTVSFPDGRTRTYEHPMALTERKSRVLAGLLERQFPKQLKRPYVETLVFLSAESVDIQSLDATARARVVTRADLVRAITLGEYQGSEARPPQRAIDGPTRKATLEAISRIGIRASKGALELGDLRIGDIVEEGPGFQDRAAVHRELTQDERRVRFYLVPQQPTAERQTQLKDAARREATLLTAVGDHPAILKLHDYGLDGPMGGPYLVFKGATDHVPLDAFLRRETPGAFTFADRVALIHTVGEALAYCHRKKVFHRGLCPSAVLVARGVGEDAGKLSVRLHNFQLAWSDEQGGTRNLSLLSDDDSRLYRAPEVLENPDTASVLSDMFSLGVLAYTLLTGRSPGPSLSDRKALLERGGGGLSLAAAGEFAIGAAGAGGPSAVPGQASDNNLDALVSWATRVDPTQRPDSVFDWVEMLVDIATAPLEQEELEEAADGVATVDPLIANAHDVLEQGFEVVKVLGAGATARVVRVRRDGDTYALKVAREDQGDRLRAEGAALRRLSGDRIIHLHEILEIGGRTCLLLADAGDTLADLLAREGAQPLDFSQRWGDDLLLALRVLEENGVLHRDIKPANAGITPVGQHRARSLFLFDFSLAGVPVTETSVGTPAYRDPLVLERAEWDAAADRFSAALTLYEMLTGVRPAWSQTTGTTGLGRAPHIDAEAFDPTVRGRLAKFFETALNPDVTKRHVSAESMRAMWNQAFDGQGTASGAAVAKRAPLDLAGITADTPVHALELDNRALNALDRSGITDVRGLLALPMNHLSAVRGVGRETAREIVKEMARVRAARPDLVALASNRVPFVPEYSGPSVPVGELGEVPSELIRRLVKAGLSRSNDVAAAESARLVHIARGKKTDLDRLRKALLRAQKGAATSPLEESGEGAAPRTLAEWERVFFTGSSRRNDSMPLVRETLRLDPLPGGGFAEGARAVAKAHGCSRANVYLAMDRAVTAWTKEGSRQQTLLELLRTACGKALDELGTVAELSALARRVGGELAGADGMEGVAELSAIGEEEALRQARALVLLVARVGGEGGLVQGRALDGRSLLARSSDAFAPAQRLGSVADALALREPLPSPPEVLDALAAAVAATSLAPLSHDALTRVAAAMSGGAAASPRLEIYPRDLSGARALRLSASAISGQRLTTDQVRGIALARYPAAASPSDEEVAEFLEGLGFQQQADGFVRKAGTMLQTSTGETSLAHLAAFTTGGTKATGLAAAKIVRSGEVEARDAFLAQLQVARKRRDFRLLTVEVSDAPGATAALGAALKASPVSLDALVLDAFDAILREEEVDPSIVQETDRRGPASDDWGQLRDFMQLAADRAIDRLLVESAGRGERALLLTDPGLFGRFRLTEALTRLVGITQGGVAGAPGVFLVAPTLDPVRPVLPGGANGTGSLPVPLTSPGQHLRVPGGLGAA